MLYRQAHKSVKTIERTACCCSSLHDRATAHPCTTAGKTGSWLLELGRCISNKGHGNSFGANFLHVRGELPDCDGLVDYAAGLICS